MVGQVSPKRRYLLGKEASIIIKERKNLTRKLMVYTTVFVYYGQVNLKFTAHSSHMSRVCACC